MKSRQKHTQKDIVFILVSSFIVVVAWISFNIYHIQVTSTISQHIQYQLNTINPNFDQQTLQNLKSRENVNPLYQQTASAVTPTLAETSPTPTNSSVASSEAFISRQGQ